MKKPGITTPYGQALYDYFLNNPLHTLYLNNNYGPKEEMPIEVFFRDEEDFPELESYAMEICYGSVLDIGAGVGSHALFLQERNMDVTALEIDPASTEIMRARGVRQVVEKDIFKFEEKTFDTLLMMMNGLGLVGSVRGLAIFLNWVKKLIKPGGQLLFDSSDVAYVFEDVPFPEDRYYGELKFQYEYNGKQGNWFPWLYIDQKLMLDVAKKSGWTGQVIYEDEFGQYLAKLVL
ncbi:class I SAM-dependent methyltransferase [Fulvivirgaceae bacterium BMA10]|uniref:Class I SAM-dependent methyltransferase n=1 Tax=Splendidivirga corallicola TaxID=3051826 RepID=A0ABT8KJQ4_9BACT|nr:class I SAM-dependent methyltransferase [Fulvivirgaceae bacterium BMA10]